MRTRHVGVEHRGGIGDRAVQQAGAAGDDHQHDGLAVGSQLLNIVHLALQR